MTDPLSGHPFSDCEIQSILPKSLKSMNINITIEGVDGKDARQQLLNFLGAGQEGLILPPPEGWSQALTERLNKTDIDPIVVQGKPYEEPKVNSPEYLAAQSEITEKQPAEEQPKKKRRTQAEIAAEREALEHQSKTGLTSTDDNEPDTSQEPAGPVSPEETTVEEPVKADEPASAITAEDLTKKAVELGRAGKRDEVLKTLEEKFGGATIAKKDGKPQLQPEQYQAVMDAFNGIG